MISINQLNMTQMLAMLRDNPGLAIFPFPTQEYPLGVTRAALVAAFNAKAGNSANFDTATGKWNCQRIELGNTNPPYGESVNGGVQSVQKYQVNASGQSVATLPTVAGAFNTGNFVNNPGEFSPAGTVQDVPPNTPTVGAAGATATASPTVASGNIQTPTASSTSAAVNTATMVNTPSQVN
jgi:hypothetical protein